MKLNRYQFPDDKDNRIANLYYDVNIHTIFNRTKLQNIKNKFIKYGIYLIKYGENIQIELLRLEQICRIEKIMTTTYHANWSYDQTSEKINNFNKFIEFLRKREQNCIECSRYINIQKKVNEKIDAICVRINQIKTHQTTVRKHYKKCGHCEKMNMITICGCKYKHKLCSDCIYDKTECPVCKENLGLINCDICMEYKKILVNTGCNNNHKICKYCLDKISDKKIAKCPFCRDTIIST